MQLATLPLVLVVVLVELAVGGAFLLWALDRTRQAPSAFLKLIAGVDAACGILAFVLLPALPSASLAEKAQLHPGALESLTLAVRVLGVLLVLQLLTTFVPWRTLRAVVSFVTLLVGGGALVAAAVARPGDAQYDVFALAALPLGAVALGGVDGAMLLGHWYLVTPKLSPLPLQRASLIVVAALALQALVVTITVARGELIGALDTSLAVAIGIRIGVGILMTFGLVVAAWWTARMNAQSSTGLLYVGLGTALAGEVAARVLYYVTGSAI